MKNIVLTAAILIFTMPVQGVMYKCEIQEESYGEMVTRTHYTQIPCAEDAQQLNFDYQISDENRATSQERVDDLQRVLEQGKKEEKIKALTRMKSSLHNQLATEQSAMEQELNALKAKKRFAANNAAGAQWEQSISDEMLAVTQKYKVKIEIIRSQMDNTQKQLEIEMAN
ncbi:MAG: hypothetical protein HQL49_10350 [Gammaproteobacteria bacterium]|nr:hypothetical protein [Gammaproteobacteria bacterium]